MSELSETNIRHSNLYSLHAYMLYMLSFTMLFDISKQVKRTFWTGFFLKELTARRNYR